MHKHEVIDTHSIIANIINTTLYSQYEIIAKEGTHSKRVSELCKTAGVALELPEIETNKLRISGLFHDIGKNAIDERVLNKSGPLTVQEWNEIKRHPEIGYRILCSSPEMTEIAQYVLYHHERFDGSGYPRGLKQEEIPFLSRVISVADSYDAMTNQRSYKQTLNKRMAVKELLKNKGEQFDPNIVDVFIEKVLNNIDT